MRTRESIWQKYYNRNALFVRANFGCTLHRDLVDRLITSTKPLAKYKPEFDLLYECRKLHKSLSNINVRVFFIHLYFFCIDKCTYFISESNIMVIKKDCKDIRK